MTDLVALYPPRPLSARQRCAGGLAVAAATLLLALTRQRPTQIRRILRALAGGAVEADLQRAQRAHGIVTTVSLRCASGHGCLLRSLAIVVLCRLWGTRVTWRVGVHSPGLQWHAWVEAEGEPVGEPVDPRTTHTPVMTI